MSYQHIKFEIDKEVGFLTLNRPDKLNSINREMGREIRRVFESFAPLGENRGKIRALLISSEGRAFCAGQDLEEAAPQNEPWPNVRDIVREIYNPIIKAIRTLEVPVICAVNGIAAGAGANIALACDFVLASTNAYFLQAFCHIGLIPDSGGTYFLPRLVGLPRATAMMMLGERIYAQDAFEMGMIYKVCPADTLMEDAYKLALDLAVRPTRGLGYIKRAINQSLRNDLETQLQLEEELQGLAASTQDYHEGVQAFLEKRKPEFHGK